jgi:hypothetical protein
MSKIVENTKSAVETAPLIAEGVVSGFVLMALPLLLMGMAAGLGLRICSWPIRLFNRPSSGGSE